MPPTNNLRPNNRMGHRNRSAPTLPLKARYHEIRSDPQGRTTDYNLTITVSPAGEILSKYRNPFLYYTDETWGNRRHPQ